MSTRNENFVSHTLNCLMLQIEPISLFASRGWVAVAVKTLKVGSSCEQKLDFLGEAEVMKRFEHKNIVRLLGVCTKNEPVYTIMEFMLYGIN